ncbi:MAG: tetratricopeptide repeat protein [Flavobacteriales bacterium]|nr:tetratricopeptide repeat protein [Flavobacteriales bacterium]
MLIHTKKDTTRVNLLNNLAFNNYGFDHKKMKIHVDEANALAKEIKFIKGEARSVYMNGVFYFSKNELDKASTLINESLSLYKKIEDEPGISGCYDLMGSISNYQGDYDKSMEHYDKALKIAIKSGNKKTESRTKLNIGGLYQAKGDYDSALKYYKEALVIDESLKAKRDISGTLNNIGIIYTRQGRYLEALERFQRCLSNFKEEGNKRGVATTLQNMGNVYSTLKYYEKAETYYLETLEIQQELGNEREVLKTLINLGGVYKDTEKYDKALDYYKEALKIGGKINSTSGKQSSYYGIGIVYNITEELDLALSNFNKSLKLSLSLGNKRRIAVSYMGLGAAHYNSKNYKKAFENAIKGKELADELSLLKTQRSANLLLSELYEATNNHKEALKSFKDYKTLNDSMFNKENIEKIAQLEYEYKYKQELESANYRELKLTKTVKKTSQDLKKSQQNFFIGIIVLLLVTILLGAIISYLKLRNVKSKIQNIAVEQKLLRSQMTPHFIFNSLSVLQGMILNKEEKKSVSYLSKFSKLLRIILENSRYKTVALNQEITAIENYLALQNLENEAYQYSILVGNDLDKSSFQIPPMLIQPFVENAIEHAFRNQIKNKKIDIQLSYLDENLICTITDNGVGIDNQEENKRQDKKSLSTTITSERLKMLSKDFKMEGSIRIEDRQKYNEQGTIVTLVIPYKIEVV